MLTDRFRCSSCALSAVAEMQSKKRNARASRSSAVLDAADLAIPASGSDVDASLPAPMLQEHHGRWSMCIPTSRSSHNDLDSRFHISFSGDSLSLSLLSLTSLEWHVCWESLFRSSCVGRSSRGLTSRLLTLCVGVL